MRRISEDDTYVIIQEPIQTVVIVTNAPHGETVISEIQSSGSYT